MGRTRRILADDLGPHVQRAIGGSHSSSGKAGPVLLTMSSKTLLEDGDVLVSFDNHFKLCTRTSIVRRRGSLA